MSLPQPNQTTSLIPSHSHKSIQQTIPSNKEMATINLVFPLTHPITTTTSPFLNTPLLHEPFTLLTPNKSLSLTTTRAMDAQDFLGDFGARDPFPAELESKFGEKVLGNTDTQHKILIPNISALSLSHQHCSPISPIHSPMSHDHAHNLIRKVVGWRLLQVEDRLKLQCLWKLKDYKSGVELINRIYKVVEAEGHFPNIHLEEPNQVRAELWTASIGGLTMNDFIVAAKIDEIKTSDLVPRKRVWA